MVSIGSGRAVPKAPSTASAPRRPSSTPDPYKLPLSPEILFLSPSSLCSFLLYDLILFFLFRIEPYKFDQKSNYGEIAVVLFIIPMIRRLLCVDWLLTVFSRIRFVAAPSM